MSKNIDTSWLCGYIKEPTRKEILKQVTILINTGEIASGAVLPPVRELSAQLGVSPATISYAWSTLKKYGMLAGTKRQGVTVIGRPVSIMPQRFIDLSQSNKVEELDLTYSVADPSLLPDINQAMIYAASVDGLNGHKRYPIIKALQQSIAENWPYRAEAFMVTNSNFETINLVLKMIALPGASIVVDQPVSLNILDAVKQLDIQVISVACDKEGPIPEELHQALAQKPVAFIYQPRSYFIYDQVITKKRMKALSSLLKSSGTLIIEDDIIGPLSPYNAISMGKYYPEKTLYIRSYSRAYGADLCLSIFSASHEIVEQIQNYRSFTIGWTSRLLQQALVWLLNDQQTQMHIQHARKVYAERYNALIDALKQRGKTLPHGEGLNLWLAVPSEAYALDKLMEKGILALGGSMFGVSSPPHIRVSTSLLQSHQVDRVADALIEALRGPRRVWRLTCNSV